MQGREYYMERVLDLIDMETSLFILSASLWTNHSTFFDASFLSYKSNLLDQWPLYTLLILSVVVFSVSHSISIQINITRQNLKLLSALLKVSRAKRKTLK